MKGKRTREKILDTSIMLFNEKQASNVSTVQISAAMKISPGNLYYYFANREDVIRCIWKERMLNEIEALIAEQEAVHTIEQLRDFLAHCMEHCERYRFFYTELPTLFGNDPELMGLCKVPRQQTAQAIETMFDRWIAAGLMKALGAQRKKMLGDNCCTVLRNAILYEKAAMANGVSQEEFREDTYDHVVAVLEPYLQVE